MANYPHRLEVICSLLRASRKGATQSALETGTGIPAEEIESYLLLLRQREIIQYDEKTHAYRPTKKGKKFLKLVSHMDEYLAFSPRHTTLLVKLRLVRNSHRHAWTSEEIAQRLREIIPK